MPNTVLPPEAISAAAQAFPHWSRTPLPVRVQIIRQYAAEVAANADTLVGLLMEEAGKLRADAESEVAAVIAKAEISIEMMDSRRADASAATPTGTSQIRYRPLGVVLVLGPFNFPAHLPGGHIIPALLAGNTVVFKPSELASRVGQWVADAWSRAGLVKDALVLLQGGAEVAKAAISDERLAGVFFTGGYETGVAIHRQLAGRPDVLLALEMGGLNPLILTPPYNVHRAASLVVSSTFISAGQRCTCARRLIVVDDERGQQTVDELVRLASELKCGLPEDEPTAEMGPVITAAAAQKLLRTQQHWLALGGSALLPMTMSSRSPRLVTPGIVDMTRAQPSTDQEWFGPLLQVYRVTDFDAATTVAGATKYGLAAALIGGDRAQFERFRNSVSAGVINWNTSTTGASSRMPFGGIGKSGNHRPAGSFTIDFCNDPVASLLAEQDEK